MNCVVPQPWTSRVGPNSGCGDQCAQGALATRLDIAVGRFAQDREVGAKPFGKFALDATQTVSRCFNLLTVVEDDRDVVRGLAKTVDVFIENFRPGVVRKYGLDYASVAALKSDIVYCSISGYGHEGEWAGRGAYDHVMQALTGMMLVTGNGQDDPPVKVGFPVIDVAVGMLSALAIVSSIHRRDREGLGQYVDASMAQAALALMYPLTSAALSTGKEPERLGNRGYSGSPTADTYQCTDGWLSTAANTPPQFRNLARVLGVEALCTDARALDLEAFNAPNGGFVVAKDLEYIRGRIREAFRRR